MKKDKIICQKQIIDILNNYDIIKTFENMEEFNKWFSKLNELQIRNILSLSIDPDLVKFDTELLINLDLLNTTDYIKRVEAFVSIKNAEGWYHLFYRMLTPDFLNSPKFYQDIETLKRAKSAQTPLWIIGKKTFIDSPYHDEDFELLVTAKDNSEKKLDFILSEVLATIAGNLDSIKSEYHKIDLETIVKYGSAVLQTPGSYPENSIGYLAINKVSLNDRFHLENMELLANNPEIGNYLYPIMTNEEVIKKPFYRRIIEEMIEHKDNKYYSYMLCWYAVGHKAARNAQFLDESDFDYIIEKRYDFDELLKKIDEKLNVIEGEFVDASISELKTSKSVERSKSLLKRIFSKNH